MQREQQQKTGNRERSNIGTSSSNLCVTTTSTISQSNTTESSDTGDALLNSGKSFTVSSKESDTYLNSITEIPESRECLASDNVKEGSPRNGIKTSTTEPAPSELTEENTNKTSVIHLGLDVSDKEALSMSNKANEKAKGENIDQPTSSKIDSAETGER